jgi:DNA-binding transcriptional LysR family regulator
MAEFRAMRTYRGARSLLFAPEVAERVVFIEGQVPEVALPKAFFSGQPIKASKRSTLRSCSGRLACATLVPVHLARMQHRQLEAFRALMTSGTASRAAELLGITQPAVSRSIVELEAELGFALFDRVKNRMLPTPEAQLFFTEVEISFQGLERLRVTANRIRDSGAGNLKVGCLPALCASVVAPAIKAFQCEHPEIAISLHVRASSVVRDLVASGQCDVGLVAEEVDLSGVIHEPFASYRVVCVMAPDHPLAARESIVPADLDGQPYIRMRLENSLQRELTALFEASGARPRLVVETEYSHVVCTLALQGVGFGLVNPMAAHEARGLGLVVREFSPPVYFRKLLLFPAGRLTSRVVRAFLQRLHCASAT